ncbi:HAD family phosphatase [Streptomyces carpaticus]|uniref:Haloacid dehalogenase superfamily, subfamily IA, variant 3 with third motif having DD or ED/haloacid dehalogenase superfamily, subfamily IA, variant 1 with third motif having Dx(3-4)D or Dx(3-4)E n=2 Tax=Streptomyces TaxID=1883 RepID=A0A1I6P5L7_9ACTN|nr:MULTISPECIES: HAD family phosphatase [Streptomyces]MCK1817311.1 HAD family phosphatase [Streptomyces sp. XM4011]QKV70088.1 HAD-IA family hydrolase [Streptomyces harbinensis]UWM50469.1 HAD family phosphatase [Streptomyces carpaticus]SFS35378.1 haloacid dehalogenase superfamily, subfamily IA, variant 3 with third motif having DD or ED/haloacid dehalogenase superfamily, subfamily IA, variant 1 with third motif having Dx(3-4)D or Dx(3-4)E [Streptomyces harbinensis]
MRRLLSNAHCVLFDFDGPVCRLFSARPADAIAHRLRALAVELGADSLLTPQLRASPDPQQVLRGIARHHPSPTVVHRIEAALTREEISAAATAAPTPYAAPLIAALSTRGRQVAIVTNNSPLAAEFYLRRQQLSGYVAGRVHGRTRDITLLKPHPDVVLRALRSTGTPAGRALMIGDTSTDLTAARSAGVRFLGYALDDAQAAAFRRAGADYVTRSLEHVLTALIAPTHG